MHADDGELHDRRGTAWLIPAGFVSGLASGQRQHAQAEHQAAQGEMDRRDVRDAEDDLDRGEYEEACRVQAVDMVTVVHSVALKFSEELGCGPETELPAMPPTEPIEEAAP